MAGDDDKHSSEYVYKQDKVVRHPTVGWVLSKFGSATKATLSNVYFWANIVFLAYSIGILIIDFYPWDPNNYPYDYINQQYTGWNWVHIINAVMYILSWLQVGYPVLSFVHVPEVLNIVGAALYLSSGYLYPDEDLPSDTSDGYSNDASKQVRRIEMAASVIELVAAFLWSYTWWLAYERVPGRGWSMDDPDTWSNIFIILGAFIYICYNAQVMMDPSIYAGYYLYTYGDICYFISAVFYVVAALRDKEWFFCLPLAGKWGYQMVPLEEIRATGHSAQAVRLPSAAKSSTDFDMTSPMASTPGGGISKSLLTTTSTKLG